MKKQTIVIVITAALLLSLLPIGGCSTIMNSEDIITSKEQAHEYACAELEKKYGEPFIFVSALEDKPYGIGNTVYRDNYAPVNRPEQEFYASVSSHNALLMDSYPLWYYKAEAEALCSDICDSKSYIDHYSVELHMSPTALTWNKRRSIAVFFGQKTKFDPYNDLQVWLRPGLTDEQYAEQILGLTEELNQLICGVKLSVFLDDEYLFWHKFEDVRPGDFSIEDILRKMQDEKDFTEARQLDDEMKRNRAAEEAEEDAQSSPDGTEGSGTSDSPGGKVIP